MSDQDIAFYERRFTEELALAKDAATREAASAHRVLAEMYGQRLARRGPAAGTLKLAL